MKLTGRNGVLRILDGARVLHGAAPLAGLTVDAVKFDGTATWTNITANVVTDDTNYANDFLADNNDVVYLGSTSKFAMFRFLKGGGANYAAGSGAMIVKYWNGMTFNGVIAGVNDGTLAGGNCFAQDGYVSFRQPAQWRLGANVFNANLDADKYYIAIMTTSSPSVDPDADILCPVEGQYLDVPFAAMDFSGPLGRKLREEILVLERGTMNANGHYILGPSDPIMEPLDLSFSCFIHSDYGAQVMEAIACGTVGAGTTWTAAGTTTKGLTKNDGTNFNPGWADANKKAVNAQIVWDVNQAIHNPFGMAYYETWFDLALCKIVEGMDSIPLSAAGKCYGVIERICGLGNRY